MLGYIVGVGLFGVPYAYVVGGTAWGIGVTVLAGVVLALVHLMFAQLIAATPERIREVGAARLYLGPRWGGFALAVAALGFYGGMLAYIIAAGRFADILMPEALRFGPDMWAYLCFAAFSVIVLRGREAMARTEALFTFALILAVLALLAIVVPEVAPENFTAFAPRGALQIFGVAVYAMGGVAAVPTVLEVMRGDRAGAERSVVRGTLLALGVTVAFGVVVAGASGLRTTEEAVGGLVAVVGPVIVRVAALFGLLGIATSFLPLSVYLRDIWLLDVKLPKWLAWTLALVPPIVLFALGARSFIRVIGFTGGVLGGVSYLLLVASYLRARRVLPTQKRALLRVPEVLAVFSAVVLLVGMLAELSVNGGR